MTNDLIRREAAKSTLRHWITDCMIDGDNDAADNFWDCIDLLDDIAAVDAVPVVHGEWIPVDIGDGNPGVNLECSHCGRWVKQKEMFCPTCGARMDGERKEDKHGEWIEKVRHEHYPSGKPYPCDYCSACGKRGSAEYNFCPNCGAKMDGGKNAAD